MNRLRLIKTIYTALAALMLAACASDELTDGTVQDLPEGMYPLQIAGVSITAESNAEPWGADTPQTRMAENTTDGKYSSAWESGDKIKVQIGDVTPGTYTYQSSGLTVADGDAYAYWPSKADNQIIRAWYTSSGNETVDLSDQTKGLAYVVTAQTTANFNTEVSLTFSHALAKVRVELTGEIASFVDNVSIKSYTTCALSQGTWNGANVGEIKMYKVADKVFEANVYPGYQIQEVKANNGAWSKLSTAVTPEAAKIYKMGIGVTGKTITLSDQTGEVCTVESGKSIIIDGGGNSLNKRIVIQDNAKVMLKNVKLAAPTTEVNTIEINGSATLLLSGTNEINGATQGCPLTVIRGTLTINGTDNDKLTLTGENSYNAGCLGLREGASLIINGGDIVADGSKTQHGSGIGAYWTGWNDPHYGSITINGGKINASGGGNSAGIGSGSQCGGGDIIITGGNITATGGGNLGGAGIGTGDYGNCGDITISGTNTVVTATVVKEGCDKIGLGYNGRYCGTVTIKAGVTVNNTKYTSDHVGRIE